MKQIEELKLYVKRRLEHPIRNNLPIVPYLAEEYHTFVEAIEAALDSMVEEGLLYKSSSGEGPRYRTTEKYKVLLDAKRSEQPRAIVDASLFMGMNAKSDPSRRITCKNYFVNALADGIKLGMPLEQVGKCDDAVWGYPRVVQDAYYPFMDWLHSVLNIERFPYKEKDFEIALQLNSDIILPKRLVLASAINRDAVLYTIDEDLLTLAGSVKAPEKSKELKFPENLEKLYQDSLRLRHITVSWFDWYDWAVKHV